MGYITLIVGIILVLVVVLPIVAVVQVFWLRKRVQQLEQLAGLGSVQGVLHQENQPQSQPTDSQFLNNLQRVGVQQKTIPADLLDYIKQQIMQGVGKEEIKNALVAGGWQVSDVEEVFSSITSEGQLNQHGVIPAQMQIEPTWFTDLGKWLKEDWLLKLGALFLLIGFGWLTTYAFMNNWIGPMGRIAIGIIAGALIMLLGWWRIKKYINQGGIFLVLGSTTILLTIFAAREFYDYFDPVSALAVMFLSIAFVALASVKYNSGALSLLSLILAGIAPLFTNISEPNHIGLFAYLLIVVLGTIWIVALTGRRELTIAALLLIVFYSIPLFGSAEASTLLLFEYAFATIFFLSNMIGILKSKNNKLLPDLLTAAGNGLFLLIWIMNVASDEWKSLIIVVWMMIFMVSAFLITKITQKTAPFYIYAGVGIMMLVAATSLELKGAALVMAYTIEGGLLSLITYFVIRKTQLAEQLSWLLIYPIILSFRSMTSSVWRTGFLHEDFFVLFVLMITLFGLGLFFGINTKQTEDKKMSSTSLILLVGGSFYFYITLWLSLHSILSDDVAVMISLIIYTIIGLICYFNGLLNNKKVIQVYGGILIGFVVSRVLLVDIWQMEMAGKIVTFFLLGALLVSTTFLGKKRQAEHNIIKNPDPNNQ
ncbi:DUF2339 domain-containing protein [Patescibacteria group bacterium]|nr:DUF2339 domain-containing protein [Patescibacteria group bacterium]MBU1246579.1 DUF2339 domain-containing protein [Patescibacteria group bacterium]MBU1519200.1 DUF2339 domain-containing protein [Patescibacteria group bacterium]MBU1730303.1 DUF2339 domain-containing protein [Patescibacteria group bacterium]MBU2010041.1 DUF2339 domain-containing protein [Patescibacteria group bacterium]